MRHRVDIATLHKSLWVNTHLLRQEEHAQVHAMYGVEGAAAHQDDERGLRWHCRVLYHLQSARVYVREHAHGSRAIVRPRRSASGCAHVQVRR